MFPSGCQDQIADKELKEEGEDVIINSFFKTVRLGIFRQRYV